MHTPESLRALAERHKYGQEIKAALLEYAALLEREPVAIIVQGIGAGMFWHKSARDLPNGTPLYTRD